MSLAEEIHAIAMQRPGSVAGTAATPSIAAVALNMVHVLADRVEELEARINGLEWDGE